ncbi:hypothetical protein K1X41_11450 [Leucobacter luti]|nr:hypothetical protein K1X41_11450 [Leucobacter luti]
MVGTTHQKSGITRARWGITQGVTFGIYERIPVSQSARAPAPDTDHRTNHRVASAGPSQSTQPPAPLRLVEFQPPPGTSEKSNAEEAPSTRKAPSSREKPGTEEPRSTEEPPHTQEKPRTQEKPSTREKSSAQELPSTEEKSNPENAPSERETHSTGEAPRARDPQQASARDEGRMPGAPSTLRRPHASGAQRSAAPAKKAIQALALYAFEVIEGKRTIAQLAGTITPEVRIELQKRRAARTERRTLFQDHRLLVPIPGPVHVSRPCSTVIEAAVALHAPERTIAVALRLELTAERWRATHLTVL